MDELTWRIIDRLRTMSTALVPLTWIIPVNLEAAKGQDSRRSQRRVISSLQEQLGLRSFESSKRLVHTFTVPAGQYPEFTEVRDDITPLDAQPDRLMASNRIIDFLANMSKAYSSDRRQRVTGITSRFGDDRINHFVTKVSAKCHGGSVADDGLPGAVYRAQSAKINVLETFGRDAAAAGSGARLGLGRENP